MTTPNPQDNKRSDGERTVPTDEEVLTQFILRFRKSVPSLNYVGDDCLLELIAQARAAGKAEQARKVAADCKASYDCGFAAGRAEQKEIDAVKAENWHLGWTGSVSEPRRKMMADDGYDIAQEIRKEDKPL